MVRELVDADVDFIKDDEKLMSPAYSSLADRVKAIMPIILDREQKTGKKVMYAFGISMPTQKSCSEITISSLTPAETRRSSTSIPSGSADSHSCASARALSCTPIAMVGTS